jgi:hypothetical protein
MIEQEARMLIHRPPYSECKCDHDPAYLLQEIAARRWIHEYRERRDTGEIVLVCLSCFGLWNHRFTDQIIAMVQSGEAQTLIDARGG